MDIALRYGCNPHQTPAGVTVPEEAGFEVLSGWPGYTNYLDICLSSDVFTPLSRQLGPGRETNVRYVAQTRGSARDDVVTKAAGEYGMTMVHTGRHPFLH